MTEARTPQRWSSHAVKARIRVLQKQPLRIKPTAYALSYQPAPTQGEWGYINAHLKTPANQAKIIAADSAVIAELLQRIRSAKPFVRLSACR